MLKRKFWFILVGGSAALLYLVLATLLFKFLKTPEWLASAIAWTLCIIPAYYGQKILTFASKSNHIIAFPRYLISQIIAIILSTILSFFLSHFTKIHHIAIFIIVILVVIIASYLFQLFWVFDHDKR